MLGLFSGEFKLRYILYLYRLNVERGRVQWSDQRRGARDVVICD